jgi:hypothetical protein
MSPQPTPQNNLTDHDLLIRIDQAFIDFKPQLEIVTKAIFNHTNRLENLEKWNGVYKIYIAVVSVVLLAMTGTIITLGYELLTHQATLIFK